MFEDYITLASNDLLLASYSYQHLTGMQSL